MSNDLMDRADRFDLNVDGLPRPMTPPNQNLQSYLPPTPIETPQDPTVKDEPRPNRFANGYDESMEETVKPVRNRGGNPRVQNIFQDIRQQSEQTPSRSAQPNPISGADSFSIPLNSRDLMSMSNFNDEFLKIEASFDRDAPNGLPVDQQFPQRTTPNTPQTTHFMPFDNTSLDNKPDLRPYPLNKRESADYRVRMRKQADEIKKLKEEIEKRDAAKARSDKSVMQMKNTHSRQLKTMQDRIRELEQSRLLIDGELKKSRNGLKPRPQRATTTPAVASPPATREEEAPPPTPVSQRKEVRFDLENIDYREDSRTDLSQDLTQESFYEWYPEPTFANLPMGICYPIVGVPPFQCDESFLKRNYAYQVRHNEGQECGAFLYKFYNNDAKWIYGPVEAYLHHTFPLVVKLPDLGVEIRVIRDQVEIHRPFQEITRYDLLSQTTIDTRRRRDGKGFYAVKNDVRLGVHQARQPEILAGRSDRSREEDAQVIRRGNTGEKQEYMLRNHTRRELSWFSMDIHSNQIQFYQVHVAPEDVEKPTVVVIRVGIQNQFIDIISLPSMDFVYTRHRFDLSTKGYVNCCDFGKPARDRERAGEFIAFSPELPLRIGLISSA